MPSTSLSGCAAHKAEAYGCIGLYSHRPPELHVPIETLQPHTPGLHKAAYRGLCVDWGISASTLTPYLGSVQGVAQGRDTSKDLLHGLSKGVYCVVAALPQEHALQHIRRHITSHPCHYLVHHIFHIDKTRIMPYGIQTQPRHWMSEKKSDAAKSGRANPRQANSAHIGSSSTKVIHTQTLNIMEPNPMADPRCITACNQQIFSVRDITGNCMRSLGRTFLLTCAGNGEVHLNSGLRASTGGETGNTIRQDRVGQ
jgi:hypothetical protein